MTCLSSALVTATAGCRFHSDTAPSRPVEVAPGERFLKEFPDSLSNATAIEKFPIVGARYCLVHFKQMHEVPDYQREKVERYVEELDSELSPSNSSEIEKRMAENFKSDLLKVEELSKMNQKKLQLILQELISGGIIKELRLEGLTADDLIAIDNQIQIVLRADQARKTDGPDSALLRELELKEKRALNYINAIRKDWQISLLFESDVKILPGDDRAILERGHEIAKREGITFDAGTFENSFRANMEERETFLLEQLCTSEEAVGQGVIFGAKHDWRDAIESWNQSHPDAKCCLVVVHTN